MVTAFHVFDCLFEVHLVKRSGSVDHRRLRPVDDMVLFELRGQWERIRCYLVDLVYVDVCPMNCLPENHDRQKFVCEGGCT